LIIEQPLNDSDIPLAFVALSVGTEETFKFLLVDQLEVIPFHFSFININYHHNNLFLQKKKIIIDPRITTCSK